jgi:hypothetical protein
LVIRTPSDVILKLYQAMKNETKSPEPVVDPGLEVQRLVLGRDRCAEQSQGLGCGSCGGLQIEFLFHGVDYIM